jgi:hypothetical protein
MRTPQADAGIECVPTPLPESMAEVGTRSERRRPLFADLNLLEKSEAGAIFSVVVNGGKKASVRTPNLLRAAGIDKQLAQRAEVSHCEGP